MSSQQQPPSAPNPVQTYQQGAQLQLQYAPKFAQAETNIRNSQDAGRIQEQQNLQRIFGPGQYAQQLQALQQLDPTGTALRTTLGGQISNMLGRGYINAQQAQAYGQIGQTALGELGRGTSQSPEMIREDQQAIRAGQAARGNSLGNAPAMAEAIYQGQRGQQLQQQRLQNATSFYGLQSPQAQTLAQSGSFLSLPTPESQVNQIQAVNPDRSSAYVNPNAGYQGQQFGLQNYQNQLGSYAAGGGSANPWAGALAGGASGAVAGSSFGPYGALAGGVGGAALGYFSDPKTKTDVKKVGTVGLYNYRSKLDGNRYTGPMAPEIKSLVPSAVKKVGGLQFVKKDKVGGLMPMRT